MKLQIPSPSEDALASSQQLQHIIAQEIQTHQNWIPFSRFMELALYAPQFGYYTGGSHKIGQEGDFITAPTLTPLFGQTLAHQLNQLLPQTAQNVYEFGAGTGDLAISLLPHLSNHLNHYYIIELSNELAERQRQKINATLPDSLAKKVVHLTELPDHFDGILIGNEVLDAMPVESIKKDNGQFYQIGVCLDNEQFAYSEKKLEQSALLQTAYQYFPENEPYTSELHPAQYAFIHTLAKKLTRGAMIWIDYGFDAAQYYHPQRNHGTLIGHYRHHSIHDLFFHIGLTDLTAHVNFTDIAQAGVDSGLDLIGYTTQAHFLLNLNLTDYLSQTGKIQSADYLREAAAVQKLINQHEMGELFKVIALGKNIDVDWQGFALGDICHKL